jgi:uncharacterized protein YbjT (DUF2867 family)
MEKTVLVTGATGTIGRDVAKLLSKNAMPVRAGVRDQAKAKKQFGADIALATFDFEDAVFQPDALTSVEKIFLLPPPIPNQVAVTNAFIDAAKRAGARHIVKLSAIGADMNPPYTFGKWHAAADRIRSRLHILAAEFLHAKFYELLSAARWHDLSAVVKWKGEFC